jgi:putative hemolysin
MELLIIFFLTLLNGFFSLSEIALVSVKKSRIEHLAGQGNDKAKTVLKLLENPEHFLSSVQVGITLIGIIAGAYGGATLTDDLESLLSGITFLHPYVHTFSLVTVIGGITYFTIVLGELVPKTIAMTNAEGIALTCVPIIKYFTYAVYPFVKLLSVSTNFILNLFGIKESDNDHMSEEELKFMLSNAGKSGVLETDESQVHQNIFYFNDQTAKSLMTHGSEVEWINYNYSVEQILLQLRESVHSKFIVCDNSIDKIKGIIAIKDFLGSYNHDNFHIDQILEEPLFVIQNTPSFKILNLFKNKKQYIGVVIDEYGDVLGIITLHDLIEAIVGDLPDEDESDEKYIIENIDGSYEIDGRTLIYEINQYFQKEIIEDSIENYTTLAGFILYILKALPNEGDIVTYYDFTFKVIEVDGLKIDKVLMIND